MKIRDFIKTWILFFKRMLSKSSDYSNDTSYEESGIEVESQHNDSEEPKETLLDKLKLLNVKISNFKENFPAQYANFKQRFDTLKAKYDEEAEQYKVYKDKVLIQVLHPDENINLKNEVSSIEIEIDTFIATVVVCDTIRRRLGTFSVNLQKLYRELIKDKVNKENLVNIAKRKLVEITSFNGKNVSLDVLIQEKLLHEVYYSKYLIVKIQLRYFGISIIKNVFADSDKNEYANHISNDLNELGYKLSELSISEDFQEMNKVFVTLKNFQHKFDDETFWQNLFKLEDMIQTSKQQIKQVAKIKIEENLCTLIKLISSNKIVGQKEYILNSLSECLVYIKEAELSYKNASLHIVSLILEQMPKKVKISYDELYKLFYEFGACKTAVKILKTERSTFAGEFLKVHEILKDNYSDDIAKVSKQILLKGSCEKENTYCKLITLPDDKMLHDICQVLSFLNLDYNVDERNIYVNTVYIFELKSIYNYIQNPKIGS